MRIVGCCQGGLKKHVMVFPLEHINGLIGKMSFGLDWVRESTEFKITKHDDNVFTVEL